MNASRSVRISDAERSSAMEALGIALSEGRLDVMEYDTRCRGIAEARLLKDIDPFFADLPEDLRRRAQAAVQASAQVSPSSLGRMHRSQAGNLVPRPSSAVAHTPGVYTAAEIAEAYQSGRDTRLGILSLTGVGSLASTLLLSAVWESFFVATPLLLIPTVWILLYILRVGPQSWYVPSPQRLERQRARQLKLEDRAQRLELRAKRRAQGEELTDALVDYGRDFIGRRRKQ